MKVFRMFIAGLLAGAVVLLVTACTTNNAREVSAFPFAIAKDYWGHLDSGAIHFTCDLQGVEVSSSGDRWTGTFRFGPEPRHDVEGVIAGGKMLFTTTRGRTLWRMSLRIKEGGKVLEGQGEAGSIVMVYVNITMERWD